LLSFIEKEEEEEEEEVEEESAQTACRSVAWELVPLIALRAGDELLDPVKLAYDPRCRTAYS